MKRIFTLCALVLFSTIVVAQAANRRRASFGVGIQVAQPLDRFSELYDGFPAGFQANLSVPLHNSPFELGVAAAWNSMGSQSEQVSVWVAQDEAGDDIYETAEMDINSNVYRYQVLARFRPFDRGFQIYADAIAGVQSFSTNTIITLDSNNSTTNTDQSVNEHRDFTAHYGWAGGVRVGLNSTLFIEGRFEQIRGGMAKYVDRNSIEVNQNNNSIQFNTLQSQTNMYTYQLGVTLLF
ncbi:MAG: outer membrane beta-barrel protein [Flavobacteriales bacterium]|jgi:hypothetical protein